jgi:YgiT-type zinc finger domain-containing protein
MGRRFEDKEAINMKCHVCGSKMQKVTTDIPFKANQSTIVIMKDLPVYECENCSEHLLDDPVLKRVEKIIKNVDTAAELEVIKYAA